MSAKTDYVKEQQGTLYLNRLKCGLNIFIEILEQKF